MKAVTLDNSGVLIREIDPPKPQPHQIMVKVKACGINRSDLLETQGQNFGHTGGDTKILGGEFAGEVVELGTEVEDLSIGDPVMCRGGSGWAEYALAHWRRAIPIDITNFPWEQAATIQGNMQTMHDAMVTNGRFNSGQTILIQGASSAVGLMGLLIARAMEAKLVIGTSTNSERRERLGDFGADLVLDSSKEDWVDRVLQATDGSGVDVTIGATGYNPYRTSQLASTDLWVKAGMPKALADNYLGAINGAINNLNMASDMKIPGAQKYTSVVLDTELARYLAGEITVDEALANIEEGWEEVTEDFGRDEQVASQALALGL